MVRVKGAIDNAAIWNTSYHLVFSDSELYQFLTMDGKERRGDLYSASMSNPVRMVPVAGLYSSYNTMKGAVQEVVNENIKRGREIEANIEAHLKEEPPNYTIIRYDEVKKAELSRGSAVSLPHLLLQTKKEKLKFHLVHSNYQGKGALPDDVFSSYENLLREAFQEKLTVKK